MSFGWLLCLSQGMMQATKAQYSSKEEVLQLWCHETCRIISDRMWDHTDKDWMRKQLDEKLGNLFSTSFSSLFEPYGGDVPPFVTFMKAGVESPPYEPVKDMNALKVWICVPLYPSLGIPGMKVVFDSVYFVPDQ